MNWSIRYSLVAIILVVIPYPRSVSAQSSTTFPLRGKLLTASASAPNGTAIVIPATSVGSGNVFAVTSVCWTTTDGGDIAIACSGTPCPAGGSFGIVALSAAHGAGCATFNPGFVFPQGADVRANDPSGGGFTVVVSGVAAKASK